ARVVELPLVDGDESHPAERLPRPRYPEEPDREDELIEREVRLGSGRRVPERGQEVGLPDAEPAVQVDPPTPPPHPQRRPQTTGEGTPPRLLVQRRRECSES